MVDTDEQFPYNIYGPQQDTGKNLTVQQSVTSMVRVFDGLTSAASGTFLNYDGSPLPW